MRFRIWPFALMVLAAGCSGAEEAGGGGDAAAASDVGFRGDSAESADSGSSDDSGGPFDTGETADSSGLPDSNQESDADLPIDAGTPEDSDQVPDSGTISDAGADSGADAGRDAGAFQSGDHAVVAGHTLPTDLSCSRKTAVTVTMRNMGDTTWTAADNYRLGAVDDQDPFFTTGNRVYLGAADAVAPGQEHRFDVEMTAPAATGTFTTDWRMVRDGVHWFGDVASSSVTVTCQGPRAATLADLFDGTAHFVTDQDPVPLAHEQAGHRELFAVNRTDVGPRTVYAYHRIFDRGGNVTIGLSISTNGGDSYDDYRGEVVAYDTGHIFSTAATVAKQDGKWLMAYEESNVATTYWAESADGLTWTKKGKLLSQSNSGWDSSACVTPGIFVVSDGTIYVFYAGMPRDGVNMDVGFASGKVMGALSKSPKNPVLRRPPSGWSAGQVSMPRIVLQGDYYYAIYEGATLDFTCDVKNRYGWGVARSKDLVNWESYAGNPIAQSAQQGVGCGNDMPQPFIRYDNEVFVYHTSADTRRIVRDHLVMR